MAGTVTRHPSETSDLPPASGAAAGRPSHPTTSVVNEINVKSRVRVGLTLDVESSVPAPVGSGRRASEP